MLLSKSLKLTFALVLAGFGVGCTGPADDVSTVMSSGRPIGEIRGTELINKMIRTRLLDADVMSTSSFGIEKVAGYEIYSLKAMLGQYTEGTPTIEFRGGEPNPFGLLLWQQVIARFAEGLAGTCESGSGQVSFYDGTSVTLAPAFNDSLLAACSWSAEEAGRKAVAGKLWRGMAGFSAPEEETAFASFFGTDASVSDMSGKDRVAAMVIATFLNPHVLLEK